MMDVEDSNQRVYFRFHKKLCIGSQWVTGGQQWNLSNELPPGAYAVGYEQDGSPVYVGRAIHNSGIFMVKIVPTKKSACISVNREEIPVECFEVLCDTGYVWVRSCNGHVPEGAVPFQRFARSAQMYIGRAHHEGALLPGKIAPSRGRLFIPFEGGEISYSRYDVLVKHKKPQSAQSECFFDNLDHLNPIWNETLSFLQSDLSSRFLCIGNKQYQWNLVGQQWNLPLQAFAAGYDRNGSPVYVGRTKYNSEMLMVKTASSKKNALISVNREIVFGERLQVLCGTGFKWVQGCNGHVPEGAVPFQGFAGTVRSYIGRAHHEGALLPGKIDLSRGCLLITFNDGEISYIHYDVLVNHQSLQPERCYGNVDHWVRAVSHRPLPEGAVRAGYDSDDAQIYVGRGHHKGHLLPVIIIPEKSIAYTVYCGREIPMEAYEALCNADVTWKRFNGEIPLNAVTYGKMLGGVVYIGRALYMRSLTPGMVLVYEKKLLIPFESKVVTLDNFEILVYGRGQRLGPEMEDDHDSPQSSNSDLSHQEANN